MNPRLFVFTTCEIARKRLNQLRDTLQADANTSRCEHGISLTDGPLSRCMAQLCLLPNDRIVSINDTEIHDVPSAVEAIGCAVDCLQDNLEASLSIVIERKPDRFPVVFRFHNMAYTQQRIAMQRDQAIATADFGAGFFKNLPVPLQQIAQERAEEVGDSIEYPHGLSGVWVTGNTERLRLTPYDKIVAINGKFISSPSIAIAECKAFKEKLKAGEDAEIVLNVQRGEFKILDVIVGLEHDDAPLGDRAS